MTRQPKPLPVWLAPWITLAIIMGAINLFGG
jgi:hypothetical protein